MNKEQPAQELDLAIPDMDSATTEMEVARLLEKLPGVQQIRLVERGAFVRYLAEIITHQQICEVLRRAGFRASTFQDSASGETGVSSQ